MEIIKTKDLIKKFKNNIAVNKLNLKINEGEIYSLLGVNGAGKTTTIRMITNLTKPSSGEIYIFNKELNKNLEDIKSHMNLSPQETAVALNLTVEENLDFIAGVYKINNKKSKIEELIKIFKLDEVRNQKTKKLSGGYQRRVSIAMALINDPKILFLDEPTLGLDVLARRELWKIIENLKGKMTIILTTHYMEEAEYLSDKVGIMLKGKLICEDSPKELIKKAKAKNFEDAFITLVESEELK